jgi:hypothetical protein
VATKEPVRNIGLQLHLLVSGTDNFKEENVEFFLNPS